jgi:hypothetical protein
MRAVVLWAGVRRARRLLLLTGCLILGVLGLGTVGAHAATPGLVGETFTSQAVRGSTLTGACPGVPNSNAGSFSFSVSGTAAGPFPGTFTESGSFTTLRSGFLSDFSSTFTITSTSGSVTGSKRLAGDASSASCTPLGDGVLVSTSNLATTYTATINGAQRSTGTATVNIEGLLGSGPPIFSENFASSGEVQLTSKEQCKAGGWLSFGFKNQGDCVSFVATGGKNPPLTAGGRAPVLAGIEPGALAYTENDPATPITSALTVTADGNITGATVTIGTGFASAEDVISFADQLGITGSYNAVSGVLTLSGSASVADYQTALRAVRYSNTSENPSTLTRTVTFQVRAGPRFVSNTASRDVTVTAVPPGR